MQNQVKIIFMGTPLFAVASLSAIIEAGFDVCAVITAPDKAAGRGRQKKYSPVKQYALNKKIPVLQPVNLKDEKFIRDVKCYQADIFVVVAFRMLPKALWSIPEEGTFNLHASLLPAYRGAAPINRAIINGEKKTGVTTFFINENIDTGHIILQAEEKISEKDNAGTLHDKLMNKGADLVIQTIKLISNRNKLKTIDQKTYDQTKVSFAPKISKEDCRIDWNQTTNKCHNFIRGLSPYPGAWTYLINNKKQFLLKIYKSGIAPLKDQSLKKPGTICTDSKAFFYIYTKDGYLSIEEIQLEGKKRMKIRDFLQGFLFHQDVSVY